MIHETSPRQAGPYIAVNCAAFSESLLESELFGHEKGAFTGADHRRIGQFERANQGTLFLDEVGELSAGCQARLLRVLERHPFERVGGTTPIQVNVRVVAATHADLPGLIRQSAFREDLYFRLRVIELSVPALRERGDDIWLLANHYLEHYRKKIGRSELRLGEAAWELLTRHDWPGNVRELKNAIERAVVLSRSDEVQARDLGIDIVRTDAPAEGRLMTLAEAQLRHIIAVLDQLDGNKTQACRVLGIGRGTLYKKLEEAQAANLLHPHLNSFE
jgi:Nif-specific regulatory protein